MLAGPEHSVLSSGNQRTNSIANMDSGTAPSIPSSTWTQQWLPIFLLDSFLYFLMKVWGLSACPQWTENENV